MIINCGFKLIFTWFSDLIFVFGWLAENTIFGYQKITKPCRWKMEENYPICHLHGLVIFKVTKNSVICWSSKNRNYIFQSLSHVYINLKSPSLIKSGYYIVPSPSTTLAKDKKQNNRKTANVFFLYELTGCASWGITKF